MRLDRERKLEVAHLWASSAMMFGVGYLALTAVQMPYPAAVAWLIVLIGVIAKMITYSRLEKLRNSPSAPLAQNAQQLDEDSKNKRAP